MGASDINLIFEFDIQRTEHHDMFL